MGAYLQIRQRRDRVGGVTVEEKFANLMSRGDGIVDHRSHHYYDAINYYGDAFRLAVENAGKISKADATRAAQGVFDLYIEWADVRSRFRRGYKPASSDFNESLEVLGACKEFTDFIGPAAEETRQAEIFRISELQRRAIEREKGVKRLLRREPQITRQRVLSLAARDKRVQLFELVEQKASAAKIAVENPIIGEIKGRGTTLREFALSKHPNLKKEMELREKLAFGNLVDGNPYI